MSQRRVVGVVAVVVDPKVVLLLADGAVTVRGARTNRAGKLSSISQNTRTRRSVSSSPAGGRASSLFDESLVASRH